METEPIAGKTRWSVHRWLTGKYWILYDGPEGAAARKVFEGVRDRHELGSMELRMTTHEGTTVRGRYQHTKAKRKR